MEKTMAYDLEYLRHLLKYCIKWIDNSENWEEELTKYGTVLVLYPVDSVSNIQVHFLVNGDVEIHRWEKHEVVARYTTEQFLSIRDKVDNGNWHPVQVMDIRRLVTNWVMIAKLQNQT